MAKASTARDERYQRSREASLAGAPSQPREAVPADLDRLIHERVRLGIVRNRQRASGEPLAHVQ